MSRVSEQHAPVLSVAREAVSSLDKRCIRCYIYINSYMSCIINKREATGG